MSDQTITREPPPIIPPPPPDLDGLRDYLGRVAYMSQHSNASCQWEDLLQDEREEWRVTAMAVLAAIPVTGG